MSLKAQQTQYVQQQGTYPGEDWQVDFTQMQASQGYNYLLVIAYAFTGWTEDFPTWAEEVVKKKKKKLLHEIIPRFDLPWWLIW